MSSDNIAALLFQALMNSASSDSDDTDMLNSPRNTDKAGQYYRMSTHELKIMSDKIHELMSEINKFKASGILPSLNSDLRTMVLWNVLVKHNRIPQSIVDRFSGFALSGKWN